MHHWVLTLQIIYNYWLLQNQNLNRYAFNELGFCYAIISYNKTFTSSPVQSWNFLVFYLHTFRFYYIFCNAFLLCNTYSDRMLRRWGYLRKSNRCCNYVYLLATFYLTVSNENNPRISPPGTGQCNAVCSAGPSGPDVICGIVNNLAIAPFLLLVRPIWSRMATGWWDASVNLNLDRV